MASIPAITLYETATRTDQPWNPIGLRVRFSLNYKRISYKTIQLEYPDIEPTLRKIGAAPTATKPNGQPYYTVPVIVDSSRRTPDGSPTIVSDSLAIAEYLDDAYPDTRPLFPEGTRALQVLFYNHYINTVFIPGGPIIIWPVLHLLNEASQTHWRVTREAYFGNKLEEICPKGSQKWEEVFGNFEKGMNGIASLMDKNGAESGPFVMGNTISFIDFTIASTLEALFAIIPEEREGIKKWDGGRWERLRDGCSPWLSKMT